LSGDVLLEEVAEVERFELGVVFVEVVFVYFGVVDGEGFARQDEPLFVGGGLLLHYLKLLSSY
jgi:hypothetical protein